MGPYELNIWRGVLAGLAAGGLGFAMPWLLLGLLLFIKWLGNDVDPSSDGAWLGSYFLASVAATAGFVSFGTRPGTPFWRHFCFLALVAIVIASLAGIIEGPRYKSEPPFGEKPLDVALLTVPAIVTGLVILAWRIGRGYRNRSATTGEPEGKQP